MYNNDASLGINQWTTVSLYDIAWYPCRTLLCLSKVACNWICVLGITLIIGGQAKVLFVVRGGLFDQVWQMTRCSELYSGFCVAVNKSSCLPGFLSPCLAHFIAVGHLVLRALLRFCWVSLFLFWLALASPLWYGHSLSLKQQCSFHTMQNLVRKNRNGCWCLISLLKWKWLPSVFQFTRFMYLCHPVFECDGEEWTCRVTALSEQPVGPYRARLLTLNTLGAPGLWRPCIL